MNSKLRARVIAEWRGLPERSPVTRDTARPVADPLTKVMAALGLGDRIREDEIKRAWSEVVGEFLAAHSNPTAMQDRVLIVRVIQPTLLYEFDRNLKPQIIQKLRARFGASVVRDIKFRIG
jgi:predicted nucleic acid-binding Zn ribbon protein